MQLEYDLRAATVVKNCSREDSSPSAQVYLRAGAEPARLTPRSELRTCRDWGTCREKWRQVTCRICAPRTAGSLTGATPKGRLCPHGILALRRTEKMASAGISTGQMHSRINGFVTCARYLCSFGAGCLGGALCFCGFAAGLGALCFGALALGAGCGALCGFAALWLG